MDFHQYRANVKKRRFENKKFFAKVRKKRPKDIDANIHALDEEVFAKTNCLDCAHCCQTMAPVLNRRDIDRISKYMGMKKGDFTIEYLRLDSDDDYVVNRTPCVFLNDDNHCSVYDVRPKYCQEYPHTTDNKITLQQMHNNVSVCPAVYEITEKLKRIYIEQLKSKNGLKG